MNKFIYVRSIFMARKTLTVSEEAYNALVRLKSKDESFTELFCAWPGCW